MTIEILSMTIALIAVIVGPLVSWGIAKRQISAQVISTNRQRWIDHFRDVLSEYVRDCSTLNRGYAGGAISKDEAYARYEATLLAIHKIEFMINPNEEKHAKLILCMKSIDEKLRATMRDTTQQKGLSDSDLVLIQSLTESIVKLGQGIFKSEWIRVKSGQ